MTFVVSLKITGDGTDARQALTSVRSETEKLAGATDRAGAASGRAATAARVQVTANTQLAASNRAVAGTAGNVFAQFNDIGVMMASGQSPLILAVQQGTQLSQALGQAGAGGVVGLLKGGFLSLLSPLNLITIATIGFGAAAVQALFAAGEEAESLEDVLGRIRDRVNELRERTKLTGADMVREFGTAGAEVWELEAALRALDRVQALRAAADAAKTLSASLDGGILGDRTANIGELLGLAGATRELVQFRSLLLDLGEAETLDSQLMFVELLRARFEAIVGSVGQMDGAQLQFYAGLLETEAALRAVLGTTGEVNATLELTPDILAVMQGYAEEFRGALDAATGAAEALSGADYAGPIAAALGVAQELAGYLMAAAAAFNLLPGLGPRGNGLTGSVADNNIARNPFDTNYSPVDYNDADLRILKDPKIPRSGGAAAETDAVARLVEQLRAELETLRETDPLKKAMLAHREALAGATAAERAEVESLVEAQLREKAAIEASAFAAETFGNALIDALMGGKDAGEQLIQTLARAVLQAALLGTGPLAGLFGGTGLVQMIFGGLPSADGGGYTGAGSRSGGIDGKGGFLAVLHPNETVIDHHNAPAVGRPGVAGTGGGGRADRLEVSLSPDLEARVIETARKESISITRRALTEYDGRVLPRSVARVQRDPGRIG